MFPAPKWMLFTSTGATAMIDRPTTHLERIWRPLLLPRNRTLNATMTYPRHATNYRLTHFSKNLNNFLGCKQVFHASCFCIFSYLFLILQYWRIKTFFAKQHMMLQEFSQAIARDMILLLIYFTVKYLTIGLNVLDSDNLITKLSPSWYWEGTIWSN
jgi:hypothetical protein